METERANDVHGAEDDTPARRPVRAAAKLAAVEAAVVVGVCLATGRWSLGAPGLGIFLVGVANLGLAALSFHPDVAGGMGGTLEVLRWRTEPARMQEVRGFATVVGVTGMMLLAAGVGLLALSAVL
jgi:hypothetical protein